MVAYKSRVLVSGLTFAESPRWHAGKFWFSDFHCNTVFRMNADGGDLRPVVEVPGEPSGLGWLPDDRLLVVSMQNRALMRLDRDGLRLHADLSAVATYHCNDMVVDGRGRAYVGNFGAPFGGTPIPAKLARVDPDGTVSTAASDIQFPNGCAIAPDGKTLFVAETIGGCISAFDIADDGSLSNRRVWAKVDGTPDGICLDAEGKLWVAAGLAGFVFRLEEGGRVLDRVEVTENLPVACMLGGPDRKTLYVTTTINAGPEELKHARKSKIECVEVPVPGVGWPA